jgi:hypothetical protein
LFTNLFFIQIYTEAWQWIKCTFLFDIQVIYRGSVRRLCSCPRCFSVFFSGTLLRLIGKNFWFCIRQKINKILQILAILFTLYFIAPKTLNHLAFQSFEFERTWCMLFQERVVHTTKTWQSEEFVKISIWWEWWWS